MKKGLVLLFAFILTTVFSAEVFAGEAKTNFGVKKREKKVVEQRLSQERVREAPVKKVPLIQPPAAATITDIMYSTVVDNVLGKIEQMKQEQASGPTKVAVEKPRETERAAKQEVTQAVSEAKPQGAMKIAKTPKKKERIKREVEPKRRKPANIK